jgi:hypothetical protein
MSTELANSKLKMKWYIIIAFIISISTNLVVCVTPGETNAAAGEPIRLGVKQELFTQSIFQIREMLLLAQETIIVAVTPH